MLIVIFIFPFVKFSSACNKYIIITRQVPVSYGRRFTKHFLLLDVVIEVEVVAVYVKLG